MQWQIVWCHERCCRREAADLRESIAAAASKAGAELQCLKKAYQFAEWLTKPCGVPYVLLTDWREVKLAHEALGSSAPEKRAAFTVVLCEEPKQYGRAVRWVKARGPDADPVYVCKEMESPEAFVSSLFTQLLEGANLEGHVPPGCQVAPLRVPWLGLPLETRPSRSGPLCAGLAAKGPSGTLEAKMAQFFHKVMHLPLAVVEILMGIWGSCGSSAQVERMLLEAMPEYYEE